jgi:hypothetical protein
VLAVALAAWTVERSVPWGRPSSLSLPPSLSLPRQTIWERLRSGRSRESGAGPYGLRRR